MKKFVTLAAGAAVTATALVVAPASAAPSPRDLVKDSFSLTGEFTGRVIDESGRQPVADNVLRLPTDLLDATGTARSSVATSQLTTQRSVSSAPFNPSSSEP